jgi:hypothetical protein
MTHPDAKALEPLLPLLRQLRDIKGLKEVRPGVFHCRGAAFIHFHDDGEGRLHADLKKAGGSGFDSYPLDDAPKQRKLVDDAKRRAARNDDD